MGIVVAIPPLRCSPPGDLRSAAPPSLRPRRPPSFPSCCAGLGAGASSRSSGSSPVAIRMHPDSVADHVGGALSRSGASGHSQLHSCLAVSILAPSL